MKKPRKPNRLSLIRKLKNYILETFLPAYAKELLKDIQRENTILKQEIERKNAYIEGLEAGLSKRIRIINNINGGDKN